MSDRHRRVLMARGVENRSYEEIAEAEGISVVALKPLLFRARAAARRTYQQLQEERGLCLVPGVWMDRLWRRISRSRPAVPPAFLTPAFDVVLALGVVALGMTDLDVGRQLRPRVAREAAMESPVVVDLAESPRVRMPAAGHPATSAPLAGRRDARTRTAHPTNADESRSPVQVDQHLGPDGGRVTIDSEVDVLPSPGPEDRSATDVELQCGPGDASQTCSVIRQAITPPSGVSIVPINIP